MVGNVRKDSILDDASIQNPKNFVKPLNVASTSFTPMEIPDVFATPAVILKTKTPNVPPLGTETHSSAL